MAIKHGNVSISAVKHGSVTASQVDHWNITVFAFYAVTISAGTGVKSVFISTNQNALSGSPSGTKFKKGTKVYAFAALNTAGYKAPSNWSYIGNGNIYRVGSVTVNSAYNFGTINAETVSGPCAVECSSDLIGLQSVYISTSSTATFGSKSLNVTPGNTVYGFAVLGSDVDTSEIRSSWALIKGTACKQGAIYRVGSKTPTSAGSTTTFTINLFYSTTASSTVLFTRSGEGVGSWTIDNHIIQISSANDSIMFHKSGGAFSCEFVNPSDRDDTASLGSFTCPSGYTVNLTLVDKTGKSIVLNKWTYANGPYVIDAETTADSSQT